MPVSSEADGWNFVYNDLKYAGEHLPVDKTPNGRLTSGAAYAMLSRAMLYAERWDDARIAAEKVMGMGYELEAKEDYSNAFKAGSKEANHKAVVVLDAGRFLCCRYHRESGWARRGSRHSYAGTHNFSYPCYNCPYNGNYN